MLTTLIFYFEVYDSGFLLSWIVFTINQINSLGIWTQKIFDNNIDSFKSYLSNWKQRKSPEGTISNYKNVAKNVPQGILLGPVLFI